MTAVGASTPELLDRITRLVGRYVVLPGEAEPAAIALFVLHTWAMAAAHSTPYLVVVSPEKRTGKTRLLEVLALIVRSPCRTTGTSEAALFRKIAQDSPTLLLDEIDAIFGSNRERTEPLRAILNGGNRVGATVARCVGKDHRVEDFSVFCPKVLAGIDTGQLPDTIRDRAVVVKMKRRHGREPVARLRERRVNAEAEPIREAMDLWAETSFERLHRAEPALPEALNDRAAEAWEPLLAIADLASGDWPSRARNAALALSGDDEPEEASQGALLLKAIRDALDGRDQAATADLIERMTANDELPFGAWRGGKGIDARTLARALHAYGVTPRTIRIGQRTLRGYRADDLRDAWARYLPPPAAQHPRDSAASSASSADNTDRVVDVAHVADLGSYRPATPEEEARIAQLVPGYGGTGVATDKPGDP